MYVSKTHFHAPDTTFTINDENDNVHQVRLWQRQDEGPYGTVFTCAFDIECNALDVRASYFTAFGFGETRWSKRKYHDNLLEEVTELICQHLGID